MNDKKRGVCFVVMGYGKKTDFESGRTLDLNETYDQIIKPAVEAENYRCIRADEIIHSGIIDTPMYTLLLKAELVIADISTGNINAVYELGVRHALKPYSTIIMSEDKGRLYFDLNHINTFKYEHLGNFIGASEASRAKTELQRLISAISESTSPDSPVYTYLPELQQPVLSDKQYGKLLDETEEHQESLAKFIDEGTEAMRIGDFSNAIKAYTAADKIKSNDIYIIQQLALATYKSEKPAKISSLISALELIKRLNPNQSNDPETLGITGAIHKRLWIETEELPQLNLAISYYGRGFDIRRDYYNGENLALCFDFRAKEQTNKDEKLFDQMSAKKTRESIIQILNESIADNSFNERSDKKWIFATLANCYFALADSENGLKYEEKFKDEKPSTWEIETYESNKSFITTLNK